MKPETLEKPIESKSPTHILKAKSHYNDAIGQHYRFKLISKEGKDETHKIGHLQRTMKNPKEMGEHVKKISEHLGEKHNIRISLHPSIKQHLEKSEIIEPIVQKSEEVKTPFKFDFELYKSQMVDLGIKLKNLRDKI